MKKTILLLTSYIKICDGCNSHLYTRDYMIRLWDGTKLCKKCMYAKTSCCCDCGVRFLLKQASEFDGKSFCRVCLDKRTSVCVLCEVRRWSHDILWLEEAGTNNRRLEICTNCRWSKFIECGECGVIFSKDEVVRCDGHEQVYCPSHIHPRRCDGYTIDQRKREKLYKFTKGQGGEIIDNNRFMGVEIEAERNMHTDEDFDKDILPLPLPKGFVEMGDGSLKNGTEVATPPSSGLEHYKNIKILCQVFRDNGYHIESTCGLHVHIDMRDKKKDFKYLSHLFTTFFAIEDILFAMQPESRIKNQYCKWLRDAYDFFAFYGTYINDFDYRYYKKYKKKVRMEALNKHSKNKKYIESHHYGINIHSVFYRGSLEIRMHAGSLNPIKITRWSNLLQKIVVWVDTGYNYKTVLKLLQLPVNEEKLILAKKTFKLKDPLSNYVKTRIKQFNHMNLEHPFLLGEVPKKYHVTNIEQNDGRIIRRIFI